MTVFGEVDIPQALVVREARKTTATSKATARSFVPKSGAQDDKMMEGAICRAASRATYRTI
jgi:hypothetical protein